MPARLTLDRRSTGAPTGWLAPIGAGVLLALAIVARPPVAVLGLSATVLTLLLACPASRRPRLFLGALAILLLGYALLGRGFAYLGVPPLYVGEVVLGFGLATVLGTGAIRAAMRSPVQWLLLLFVLWGAICTIPGIEVYGVEALRDAVIWGYAVFTPLVAGALLRSRVVASVPRFYHRVSPWLLAWIPIGVLLARYGKQIAPVIPGSGVPLGLKPGDASVHLAGAAAFLILGLGRHFHSKSRSRAGRWREWTLWLLWLAGVSICASVNRGGMLAIVVVLLMLVPFVSIRRWMKVGALAVLLFSAALALDLEPGLGDARKISPHQIVINVRSVTGDQVGDGSREWRLDWWRDIVNYTVFGEHFWTGKGFGINLADDDGYQVTRGPLRSPHNGHLTVLARTGVPGFTLWVLVHAAFAASLIRRVFQYRRSSNPRAAALSLWVFAYWTAFLVNGAFDVFLEGPHGGIWFWSLIGYGLALSRTRPPSGEPS